MQTFQRSIHAMGNHLVNSEVINYRSFEILPAISKLFSQKLNFATCASGRPCFRITSLTFSPKYHSTTSCLPERKLHQRDGTVVLIGNNPYLRYMTTLGRPDEPSDANQSQRVKFKRLDKTAKHVMNILDKEAVDNVKSEREIPDIRPGYIVQLKVEVPENKRRISLIKGIVIARRNAGLNTTFRLRRLVAGVGVESVFPLYSPNIKEMQVLDKKKVRRAKLYYLRDRMNALKK
ncbi:50S ribosomal protein L19, chloroplastic [Apostasia shenzhenica]|uniref:50S ribosomal protein L19, chloroplastic n=1 Tax=Apostasia shenzhenica TaxID=1088818 RepID=A0A2H9ZRG8_9ASPA|nr:50S ribosomal protein L19, chloroplastic [Apostasia shenzhenica]